jgi:protein O-GlcNAc transferase
MGDHGKLTKSTTQLLQDQDSMGLLAQLSVNENRVVTLLSKAHSLYNSGHYQDALTCCELAYEADAFRTDNLLLMGAIHFQLKNFSESIFYNQQCIRVDPNFAEGYSNLGNALKELGDIKAASQFYHKAIKLKPRFCDAYNNLASAYMQLGQTQEAIETYQMALVLNPGLVDAHSNLGNLYKASGDLEGSKRCYLEAIRIKPDFPIAWNNLAGVFKEEGQLQSSVAYYKEAIRLCPEFADAHSNLGNALKEQNQLEDAMACYQTAVKLRPDFAIAHGNLGSCHFELGNISMAIRSFKYAIQLEPNFPDAHNNLGNALREDSKLDDAIQSYRTALRLKPDHPHAYNNLGNAMKDRGLVKEAIHCYVTAIRLMPTFSAAHSNLGSILKEQGKFDQALSHYHEAVSIDPLFSDAYSNMGNVYKEIGQLEEAMKCYLTAIKLKPTHADAYSNLASVCKDCGRIVEAIKHFKHALTLKPDSAEALANLAHSLVFICDWNTREEDFAKLSQMLAVQLADADALPSVQPFHSLIFSFSLNEMLQIAQRYAQRAKLNVSLSDTRFIFRPKPKSVRLKIGYVSSDFGNHPLSYLMQSVFGLHDRNKFEVHCYSLSSSDQSSWRKKIETEVEIFKDISSLHSADAAQLIANDGIHILINLNGYTKGARNEIFALHPAPIQVAYLGYCGSMGADYIEYMIADDTVIPHSLRLNYQEKIISMPHSYFVNDHKNSSRSVVDQIGMPTRSQYGLSEDSFVYCNFNQIYKIDPEIFDVWMYMLKRVPNSVLWLLRFPAVGEENIMNEARKRGVRDNQIVFSDIVSRDEHIKRGYLADLFLDTPCCNAHTTACDILWSGTPMLTLTGDKMASRVAASLLQSVGLPELICSSFSGKIIYIYYYILLYITIFT